MNLTLALSYMKIYNENEILEDVCYCTVEEMGDIYEGLYRRLLSSDFDKLNDTEKFVLAALTVVKKYFRKDRECMRKFAISIVNKYTETI